MKYCPNPDCPFYLANNLISEFEDYVETCIDCAATLVNEEPVFELNEMLDEEIQPEALPDSELVILCSQLHPTEAHIMRGRLTAEGIPAFVANERSSSFYLPAPGGGVYLMVREVDFDQAAEVLGLEVRELEDEELEDGN